MASIVQEIFSTHDSLLARMVAVLVELDFKDSARENTPSVAIGESKMVAAGATEIEKDGVVGGGHGNGDVDAGYGGGDN
ncbi:hypothetical protein MMC21_003793 [Puttea exsequens]|nr:hypothetical protein [Puttea exsequens]